MFPLRNAKPRRAAPTLGVPGEDADVIPLRGRHFSMKLNSENKPETCRRRVADVVERTVDLCDLCVCMCIYIYSSIHVLFFLVCLSYLYREGEREGAREGARERERERERTREAGRSRRQSESDSEGEK